MSDTGGDLRDSVARLRQGILSSETSAEDRARYARDMEIIEAMFPEMRAEAEPSRAEPSCRILCGDSVDVLPTLPDGSVHTCVTSPPYFGLRDYGSPHRAWGGDSKCEHEWGAAGKAHHPGQVEQTKWQTAEAAGKGQTAGSGRFCQKCPAWFGAFGLEPTPELYVEHAVAIFREVKRVLREDGSFWLNIGDSYSSGDRGSYASDDKLPQRKGRQRAPQAVGLKPKDLIGIPWMLAFALRADGWHLRSDNLWCLSGGAWVYARTQKGDMPVMVKDLVRLSPATVKLWNGKKWTQARGWSQNKNPGERLELRLRSGERVGSTGKHLWPTQRGDVATHDLVKGDVISTCFLPEPHDAHAPGYMTIDVAWLIGLWVAEGSKSGDTLQISLNADEAPWLDRIRKTAEHLGGTMSHKIEGNKLSIRIYGRVVEAVFDQYRGGRVSGDLHLTNAAWALPNVYLKALADGYLDGDGAYEKDNDRWRLGFTRNYSLERDLRILAARLGAAITLNTSTSRCQTGTMKSFRGEWRWVRSGHGNEKDRGEVVAVYGSKARKFWDIEVEDEPHLFAIASGVLTHNSKGNAMPESVKGMRWEPCKLKVEGESTPCPGCEKCSANGGLVLRRGSWRPTRAHEYIFQFTKSADYYSDGEAVKEDAVMRPQRRGKIEGKGNPDRDIGDGGNPTTRAERDEPAFDGDGFRNKRSVWSINSQPFRGAHFAVFPPALVEPCILSSTSEKGVCAKCGAPWARTVERTNMVIIPSERRAEAHAAGAGSGRTTTSGTMVSPATTTTTTGWRATCECGVEPIPATVIDPFNGAGTTGLVAKKHGRSYIGIDVNPEYVEMSEKRLGEPEA